jgi:hypothetical protein
MTVSPVGGSQLEESTWHAGSSSKVSRASPRMDTVLTEGRGSASLKNPMLQKNMPRGKASVQYINEYELYHFWLKAPGTPTKGRDNLWASHTHPEGKSTKPPGPLHTYVNAETSRSQGESLRKGKCI